MYFYALGLLSRVWCCRCSEDYTHCYESSTWNDTLIQWLWPIAPWLYFEPLYSLLLWL